MASTSPARSEIWLVDFGSPVGHEQAGIRPSIVVSDDRWNAGSSGVVIVVPLTTVGRGLVSQVEIDNRLAGLDEVSYARCEDLRTVSTKRLIHPVGRAAADDMVRVDRVLRRLLSL